MFMWYNATLGRDEDRHVELADFYYTTQYYVYPMIVIAYLSGLFTDFDLMHRLYDFKSDLYELERKTDARLTRLTSDVQRLQH